MKGTILIFGANGFVGPYLAREFVQHGYEVMGSDRSEGAPSESASRHFTADLLDGERIADVIRTASPDLIVNLAAISSVGLSWKFPQQTMQVNIVGSMNILEGAKHLETPPKVLLVGSSEEYAPSAEPLSEHSKTNATNPYGISKATQEMMADLYSERFGIPVYKVRAFNHTGVGQSPTFVLPSWCEQIAKIQRSGKRGSISVGNTEVVRDFSDVRDVVRAYRLLLESDRSNEVFNIGSGIPRKLGDLLQFITSFCDKEVAIDVNPDLFRPADNPFVVCDNSKMKSELAWEPKIDVKDTLAEMYECDLHALR